MSTRIQQLFSKKKGKILSIYFTAGYPTLNDTLTIIQNLADAGVDLIEIGFPFSDPLADGPVIQQSSQKAIENGMTLKLLFEQLKNIRQQTNIPIILMGYLNPVLQFGIQNFVEKCVVVGIDGVIIPDLPVDYYEAHFKNLFKNNKLANILLITPETNSDRVQMIDALSDGFIYMVSSNSITGSENNLAHQSDYFDRINQLNLTNPTLIGFGIHDKHTFESACKNSSGAIIGSAFVKHLATYGTSRKTIFDFVKVFK
ncbi:MAG: tryptophan synthase subunit alpha [Flavobacteriaceae bacterium]|nr:tryptophan synthase subunit alpha [Flavobacteriaceae bacterium]